MIKKTDVILASHQMGNDICMLCSVRPASKTDEIYTIVGGRIKIKVKKKPVQGQANKAVVELLSNYFQISKDRIIISHGQNSEKKRILIKNITIDELLKTLP